MEVSIIIPTRNRMNALRNTLASIAALDAHRDDFEILIVDNGSTDDTPAVFEEARIRWPHCNWRYLLEPVPGAMCCRHRGTLEAQSDILAFMDDDVLIGPQRLAVLRETFNDPETAFVGGPSEPRFACEPPDWLQAFYSDDAEGRACMWLSLFDGGTQVRKIDPLYIWGLNMTIRKQALHSLGGFHPDWLPEGLQRFEGDGETGLAYRMRREGIKTVYHPALAVVHDVPASRLTADYFARRAFGQGIAESYTSVRENGKATEVPPSSSGGSGSAAALIAMVNRARRKSPGELVRAAWRRAYPTALTRLLTRTGAAYRAGYAFHQNAVSTDSTVLEWVLKRDYWDYRLPEGAHQQNAAVRR